MSATEGEEREDPVQVMLRQRWAETEANIAALFGTDGVTRRASRKSSQPRNMLAVAGGDECTKTRVLIKGAARQIDDDYGDEENEEYEEVVENESPLKSKEKEALPNGLSPHALRPPAPSVKPPTARTSTSSSNDQTKSSEDVRKQLEEDKKAAAEAAKRSFQSIFYTLENDRDAMLEQQKLDELDREVENEISGNQTAASGGQDAAIGGAAIATNHGTLGSADLGASSLTLKHLIARIDAKRNMVKASDNQLRTLISEVRRGRSKWASEDRVGQEELYEAAEKVLMELKAMTEYAQPFLQRVSKRDAPDYFQVIKCPMDIGTMIKKLKQLAYKSKKEFVDDLNLIWSNCLNYNSSPEHPFRKKALYMRKETEKLTPLIPDIVVRDRAEVEAEERRQHALDGDESDDDDAPIMASRGRKAPKKGGKSGPSAARKAPSVNVDDASSMPDRDVKTAVHPLASNLRNEFLRADSEAHDASSAGFSTPPPSTATPALNGVHGSGAPGSQADAMEVDGLGNSLLSSSQDDADEDDTEFKAWKQVTKKDRAMVAAARHRLFRGDQINPDEPALLRTKADMRRWMRQQKMLSQSKFTADRDAPDDVDGDEASATGETLAEGIEKDEDSTLPDYYTPLSTIPDLPGNWRWVTDSEGYVAPQSEQWMRLYQRELYKPRESYLTKKMDANMRQMQETRKICSKIGIVKQMQLQGQTYQNQFQKYEPQPFVEQDVGPVVVSEDGPLMAPWVNRAALQRSIGKVFYHAGFEDFQPSALDTVTDVATEYLMKLVDDFKCFHEQPKKDAKTPRYSFEEQVLHSLLEGGLDIEALEVYIKDDVERLSTKLSVMHDRMKSHLADLLVSRGSTIAIFLKLTVFSDLPWAITLVQMALAHFKMAASNLCKETSPMNLAKTFSAFGSSVLQKSSVLSRSVCRCICFKIVCTVHTRHSTKAPRLALASSSRPQQSTMSFPLIPYRDTLALCKTISEQNYALITISRWWRTKICPRSNGFPSLDFRLPERSARRANDQFASNKPWQKKSVSLKKERRKQSRRSLWPSYDFRCRIQRRMGSIPKRMRQTVL